MPKRSFYHSLFKCTNAFLIPATKKAPNDAIKSVISRGEKNHYRTTFLLLCLRDS